MSFCRTKIVCTLGTAARSCTSSSFTTSATRGASRVGSNSSFVLTNITGLEVKSISIVFDEGQDTAPDNFGLAVLDNVDVNSVLVGRGPTDAS